jgi:hypothetical protein
MTKRQVVICDIDGTLADAGSRMHFIQGQTKDWDSFFLPANMAADKPIEATVEIIAKLDPEFEIVFITGRPRRTLGVTTAWIGHHLNWLMGYRIYFRADEDRRPSSEVKRSHLLNEIQKAGDKVLCVFEDRAEDAAMWREEGLTCFQIAEGNF